MFDEVQRDDAHEINFRNDLETLIGKVRGQTATEAEYTQLIEKVRITEGVMLFRLSRSGISSEQERAQLERVNLGLQRMSEYLQEQYTAVFRGGIVHARFAQTEQDFLRLYTLMIIQSGINIPPADSPEKITIHTHPDFGPESVPQPSELDLGLSRGLEVSNQETGESRPAGAGFVIGFSGKGVSVYGFDFGQAELIGEFTRD